MTKKQRKRQEEEARQWDGLAHFLNDSPRRFERPDGPPIYPWESGYESALYEEVYLTAEQTKRYQLTGTIDNPHPMAWRASESVHEHVADNLIREGERIRSTPRRFRYSTRPCTPYWNEITEEWDDTEGFYEEILLNDPAYKMDAELCEQIEVAMKAGSLI
jgi:hypothetical protein